MSDGFGMQCIPKPFCVTHHSRFMTHDPIKQPRPIVVSKYPDRNGTFGLSLATSSNVAAAIGVPPASTRGDW